MGSMALNGGSTNQALLDAQLELWHSTFAHIKSMALKSALDLHIADAIHHHGDNGATIPQIVSRVTIHSSKIPCLRRLMRLFVATGVFAVHHPPPSGSRDADADEPMYMLTPTSRLLVGSQNNLTALTALVTHPAMVTPFFELGKWLLHELPDPCIFKRAHGRALSLVNDGMLSDSHFIMDIAISECAHVFGGIGSLVDVGGGLGAAAKAISKAFPGVECSVLDFDHVVAKAPSGTKVRYVVGDMFESVPPADAMFFKWVLHDWGDEECTMILKNCRKAIPPREKGGKVIIIDIVVGAGSSDFRHKEIEALFDIYMMIVNGKERNEQEWKKIFLRAGFSDYKITPVLGVRSIIEVYP
ncbi:hypothetical protein HU200_023963 [Digitaria exilis]|uniref:O-methyltransferase ZRP4 n=1 Tax=Digitaria exilis TaxID=1010633 RepID=A0A835C1W7_9POAL|nr:hypothetical protein HU200_023963 [Digitaria exilis]